MAQIRTDPSQPRLNHIAVCHVHEKLLDYIDLTEICQQFVERNDRRHAFESFSKSR